MWNHCFNLLLLLALSVAVERTTVEFEAPIAAPEGWVKGERATAEDKIQLIFALKQQNLDWLENTFWAVSNPKHEKYGQYYTLEQLGEYLQPSAHHIEAVITLLKEFNVTHFSTTLLKDFIIAEVPATTAEAMLQCQYHHWTHMGTASTITRSLGPYSLPREVAQAIDFIGGVIRFPSLKGIPTRRERAPRQDHVTPQVIREQYNLGTAVGTSSKNSQAVAQFLGQYFSPTDLAQFLQKYNLPSQTMEKIIGPNEPSQPGMEAMLDSEYIIGIGTHIPTWFVSTGGTHEGQEKFLEWIVQMIDTKDAPWVHSVSYGDVESSLSRSYTSRINVEFQKFGTMGRSILFSSGDDGVGCNKECTKFEPNFPASSPYVTAVGGTALVSGNRQTGDTISSGGFSNYFAMPDYQKQFVQKYLANATDLPSSSFFNSSGRAIPDIASFSENVAIIFNGNDAVVGGTSCASPVVAAIISLLNDQRFQQNQPSLGFLNPWIYQLLSEHPDAFTDITTGVNEQMCCGPTGFHARAGWDPITGVGTPNFANLVKYI